ncbi:hypothetical protein IWW40_005449 [Coemansia sp. RSA 1250]|nr:hypothetical protein IWW40_005449 [Coemansia sp. RSA 1250]
MELYDDGRTKKQQKLRRRSASELRAEKPSEPEEWLHEELEAVGELKRGAIAAQFPEEFSVDSDFLNGASNVWLPARLHPEIAPGEFQEWLKKHGSQLSKMEDTVNRRKSILSYSYNGNGSEDEDASPRQRHAPEVAFGVRRRNTTGLVRRKTFIERATEEQQEALKSGEETTPFLVQNVQRSSLKRSKLANKRRDSTASSSGTARRRGRRQQQQQQQASSPAVSSPLAPAAPASDEEASVASNPQARDMVDANGKRMSTAEILKQVTAAVDDFGFDEFDLGGFDAASSSSSSSSGSGSSSGSNAAAGNNDNTAAGSGSNKPNMSRSQTMPARPSAPPPSAPAAIPPMPEQPPPATSAPEKSITHKKSGSWWQWGRDDTTPSEPAAAAAAEKSHQQQRAEAPLGHGAQPVPPITTKQQQQPLQQPHGGDSSPSPSLKSKLPSPISFLRFNRKSKKDRKGAEDGHNRQQQQQPSKRLNRQQQQPKAASSSAEPKSAQEKPVSENTKTSHATPLSFMQSPSQHTDNDSNSDCSSDVESAPPAPLSSSRPGPSPDNSAGHSHIPSIITPVRPPPTRLNTGNNNRLPIHIERAIYRLASIKMANPRRPLLQQVLLSNMMFWYLELINPKSQQQPQSPQSSQPPQQQAASSQEPAMRSGSPVPFQQPQPQQQQQQQQQQQPQPQQHPPQSMGNDRRGKRGNPLHKSSREQAHRRRSGNSAASEQVVMRSPQYERQQQQIYMNNPNNYMYNQQQQQSPPSSPQSMQFQSHPASPYQNMAGSRSQPSVVPRLSQSDEDDDVPLALYRGERNAMSIG